MLAEVQAVIKSIVLLTFITGEGKVVEGNIKYTAPCSVSELIILGELKRDMQLYSDRGVRQIKVQCKDIQQKAEGDHNV